MAKWWKYIWFCRWFWLTSQQHPFHSVVQMFITRHMVPEHVVVQLVHLVVYQKQHLKATPLQCRICQTWRETAEWMAFFQLQGVKRFWGELGASDVLPALFWLCVKELSWSSPDPGRKFLPLQLPWGQIKPFTRFLPWRQCQEAGSSTGLPILGWGKVACHLEIAR